MNVPEFGTGRKCIMDQMGAMEGDGMMGQERNMEEEDIVGQGIAQLDYH